MASSRSPGSRSTPRAEDQLACGRRDVPLSGAGCKYLSVTPGTNGRDEQDRTRRPLPRAKDTEGLAPAVAALADLQAGFFAGARPECPPLWGPRPSSRWRRLEDRPSPAAKEASPVPLPQCHGRETDFEKLCEHSPHLSLIATSELVSPGWRSPLGLFPPHRMPFLNRDALKVSLVSYIAEESEEGVENPLQTKL